MKRTTKLFVAILIGFLLTFYNGILPAISEGGNVVPLPEDKQPKGGVHSLFDDKTSGSVKPLHMEDSDMRRIVAEGWATIYNGNVDQARLAALRMAYAEAVGRASGVEIGSLMLIRNVKQVSDVVMSRSRGFIRSYKIFHEGISEKNPGRYEVRIEALVVASGKAESDEHEGLRLFLELLGDPRILIMLPEKQFNSSEMKAISENSTEKFEKIEIQNNDTSIRIESSQIKQKTDQTSSEIDPAAEEQGSVFGSAEAALAQAFSVYGYQVITSDDLLSQGLVAPDILKQAKAGVTAQAVKVARAAGADIALLGVMRVSQEKIKPAGVSMVMVTAEASAKALIVSSGRMVRAFHQNKRASAPSQLKAYADCLDKAANGIADVLAWKIPNMLTRENRETLIIINNLDLSGAMRLKDNMAKITGVEAVRFKQLPTEDIQRAELILLTGFVRVTEEQIIDQCNTAFRNALSIIKSDKYELEIKVDKSRIKT